MKRLIGKPNMKMTIIYAGEEFPKKVNKTIFLAGPTPRNNDVQSWRPEAIRILEKLGYDGTVFVPEPRDKNWKDDYASQIEWERKCLDACDCILFWINRQLRSDFENIALTTNIEYGLYCKSGKIAAGAPEESPKNNYLINLAGQEKIQWETSLENTIKNALAIVGEGADRTDGECLVPQLVWNTESFQNWYSAQKNVGNELRDLKVDYVFIMPKARLLFLSICKVAVWIKSEDRIKDNEFVVSRTDICSAVMYYPGKNLLDTKIVLVKEFRSPVVNSEEFVYELPGGSSNSKKPPLEVVTSEIGEETGFKVDNGRLKYFGARQSAATLSSHRIHLYGLELTQNELKQIESTIGETHGVEEDTELTYTEIKTVSEILNSDLLDWSNIGMIMSVIK